LAEEESTVKESADQRSLQLALAVYVLLFSLKIVVYFTSCVMVLLAEALHILSDIFISGFLLVATIYSRREADQTHMFGHARLQNVAALVAATLFISFTSLRLYEEAIPRLFHPQETTYQNLNLVLSTLFISMLIAAAPVVKLLTQKKRGATAKAQFLESINDELGLLAALIGTLFIIWGQPLADPLATIVVATIIAVNAIGLLRENSSFLLGRSPGPEFLAEVERIAKSVPGVLGVHDLRASYIGLETLRADMHITVQRGLPIEEADRIAEEVQDQIKKATGCQYCTTHLDVAETDSPSRTRGKEAAN